MALGFITPRRSNHIARDKLRAASPRKLAPHTHANEVAVLAIVRYPFLDLLFVGALDLPTVDLECFPAMLEPAKTLSEPAGVLCRVAKGQPDNLGVFIGQCTLGHLPYSVCYSTGLIENQNNSLALVVQSLERFCIMFRPRYEISSPEELMLR